MRRVKTSSLPFKRSVTSSICTHNVSSTDKTSWLDRNFKPRKLKQNGKVTSTLNEDNITKFINNGLSYYS